MKNIFSKDKWFFLIIFILTCIIYGQVFSFDYVWDDFHIFAANDKFTHSNFSWQLISAPFLEEANYFRPLVILSWFIELKLFGKNPIIGHAINLVLFFINIVLIYILTEKLFSYEKRKNTISRIACLVYLLHPMNVEATVWISGRFDTMLTTFTLLTFITYIYYSGRKQIILTTFCFILALGCKESAIMILPCLYIISAIYHKSSYKLYTFFSHNWLILSILSIVLIIYFYLHNDSGDISSFYINQEYIKIHYFNKLTPLVATKEYIQRTLLPFYNMGSIFPIEYFTQKSNRIISVVIFLLLSVILIILKRYKSNFYFIISGYLLFILPVIFIVPISLFGDSIIQDRFLTTANIFFSLFVAYSYIKIHKKFYKNIATFILTIYLVFCGLVTSQQIVHWKNAEVFWETVNAYQEKYTHKQLIENFLSALRRYRESPNIAHLNRLKHIIQREQAQNAGEIRPGMALLYGVVLIENNDKEGLVILKSLIDKMPKDINTPIENYPLYKDHLYLLYNTYAAGLFWLNNDIIQANHYLSIAQKFLDPNNNIKRQYLPYLIELLLKKSNIEQITKDIYQRNPKHAEEIMRDFYQSKDKYCHIYPEPAYQSICK